MKRSRLADIDFETSEYHQDTWNRYIMLGFFSAHLPTNAISSLVLGRSYKVLRDDLLLPSATTLRKICRTEYVLTVDAIKKQLLSRNKGSLALDGWTSTNKLAIMSVIAYYMECNWALLDFQLAFDKDDRRIFSRFESELRMIGQGPIYWSRASCIFEGCAGSFYAHHGHLLGITTDNASSYYSMTHMLQSTHEASGIEWPELRNYVPCMAHVIQLALGAFMSSLGIKGRTKSWETHQHDQQFGQNESINIGKSQRLRKQGNARINMVSAMRASLAKIIEKLRIS
jgi:hypothetical protein